MKKLKRLTFEITKAVSKSLLDLVGLVVIFLILLSPGIIINYKSITEFFNEGSVDLFMTVTGFSIPELIYNSLSVSLQLIFFSLAISILFGLLIAITDSFTLDFHWLPSLFLVLSAIPVFITAFYLPAILCAVFLVCIFLLFLIRPKKILTHVAALFAFALFAVTSISYSWKVGALDNIINNSQKLPFNINLGKVINFSRIATELYIPYIIPTIILILFLFFAKKYPLHFSLTLFVSVGLSVVFCVIFHCYRSNIENIYLLAPVLSLAIGNLVIGEFIQRIRHGIREEMQFDYIKAAVARGAPIWNHIKKKILILVLNTIKSQFIVLISLTVIVEKIYNLEGLGFLVWEYATQQSDVVTVAWIVSSSIILVWLFNNIINLFVFSISPPSRQKG